MSAVVVCGTVVDLEDFSVKRIFIQDKFREGKLICFPMEDIEEPGRMTLEELNFEKKVIL